MCTCSEQFWLKLDAGDDPRRYRVAGPRLWIALRLTCVLPKLDDVLPGQRKIAWTIAPGVDFSPLRPHPWRAEWLQKESESSGSSLNRSSKNYFVIICMFHLLQSSRTAASTMDEVWRSVTWSLKSCYSRLHPTHTPEGRQFTPANGDRAGLRLWVRCLAAGADSGGRCGRSLQGRSKPERAG